jgi:hypothetical protein
MKRLLPVLGIVVALLLSSVLVPTRSVSAGPLTVGSAAEEHTCDHSGATIESLRHCVMHAYEMGHITNEGVADSLLAKLAAAQAAYNRGAIAPAISQLRALKYEVNAQSSTHIAAEHAGHLAEHIANVITALGG